MEKTGEGQVVNRNWRSESLLDIAARDASIVLVGNGARGLSNGAILFTSDDIKKISEHTDYLEKNGHCVSWLRMMLNRNMENYPREILDEISRTISICIDRIERQERYFELAKIFLNYKAVISLDSLTHLVKTVKAKLKDVKAKLKDVKEQSSIEKLNYLLKNLEKYIFSKNIKKKIE